MIFDIPQGVVTGIAGAVGSAMIYAIKVVSTELLTYLREGRKDQKEMLDLLKDLVNNLGVSRELSGIKRAVLRMNSQAFTCDSCGGWDGPKDEKPKGLMLCACSEPPPAPTSQPKA